MKRGKTEHLAPFSPISKEFEKVRQSRYVVGLGNRYDDPEDIEATIDEGEPIFKKNKLNRVSDSFYMGLAGGLITATAGYIISNDIGFAAGSFGAVFAGLTGYKALISTLEAKRSWAKYC